MRTVRPGTTRQRRLADTCLFCGAAGRLTEEHLWPKWLRTALPELSDGVHILGVTGEPEHRWQFRRRPAFTLRRKVVCRPCNEGWMSRLETRVIPILTPMVCGERVVTLAPADQELLAFWIVKTAMMVQWGRTERPQPGILRRHYAEVYDNQRPPLSCNVWIAACSHEDRPPGTAADGARVRILRLENLRPAGLPDEVATRPGYAASLSVGNLAMHILGHGYEDMQTTSYHDGYLGTALDCIWPVQRNSIEWPTRPVLNYDEFTALTWSVAQWK